MKNKHMKRNETFLKLKQVKENQIYLINLKRIQTLKKL